MARIELNKPLYKDGAPASSEPDAGQSPAAVRPPRAGMLARIGAVVVDILALHAVLMVALAFVAAQAVDLGRGGPWIGLAFGYAYFAVGSSWLTGGRTLGKFLVRIRVGDIAGPDLPLPRAMARTALLMAPLAVYIALNMQAESYDNPDILDWRPGIWLVGLALAVGWLAGNILFATSDPHGRTAYDHLTGSIETTADCQLDALHEFLRSAREAGAPAARPWMILGAVLIGILALTGYQIKASADRLAGMPAEDREGILAFAKATRMPGFRLGYSGPARRDDASSVTAGAADPQTSTAVFQLIKRGPVDVAALKADPRVGEMPARLAAVVRSELVRSIAKAEKEGKTYAPPPATIAFRITFAEFADLFFAWSATDVYSVQTTEDFSGLTAAATAGRAERDTTATATAPPADTPATTESRAR